MIKSRLFRLKENFLEQVNGMYLLIKGTLHSKADTPTPVHLSTCPFILLMTKARRFLFMSQVTQPYFYSLFVHCFLLPHLSLVNTSTGRKIRMSFLFCIFEGRKIAVTFSQNLLGKTKDERTSPYYEIAYQIVALHLQISHLNVLV